MSDNKAQSVIAKLKAFREAKKQEAAKSEQTSKSNGKEPVKLDGAAKHAIVAKEYDAQRAREAADRKAEKGKDEKDMKAGKFDRTKDAPAPVPDTSQKPLDETIVARSVEELAWLRHALSSNERLPGVPEAFVVNSLSLTVFGRRVDVLYSPAINSLAVRFSTVQDLFIGSAARPLWMGYLISSFEKPLTSNGHEAKIDAAVQALRAAKTVADCKAAVELSDAALSDYKLDLSRALVSLDRLGNAMDHHRFHLSVQKQGDTARTVFPDVLYGATGKLTKAGHDARYSRPERNEETKRLLFKIKAMCEAFHLAPVVYYSTHLDSFRGSLPASAKPFGGVCGKWPCVDSVEMFAAITHHYELRLAGFDRKTRQAAEKKKKKNEANGIVDKDAAPLAAAAVGPAPAPVPAPAVVAAPAPAPAPAPVAEAKAKVVVDDDKDGDGDVKMDKASADSETLGKLHNEMLLRFERNCEAEAVDYDEVKRSFMERLALEYNTIATASAWISEDESRAKLSAAAAVSDDGNDLDSLKRDIAARLRAQCIDDEIAAEILSRICTVGEAQAWLMNDKSEDEGEDDEDGEDGEDDEDNEESDRRAKSSSSKRKREEKEDEAPDASSKDSKEPAAAANDDDEPSSSSEPAAKRRRRIQKISEEEEPSPAHAPAEAEASEPATQSAPSSPKVDAAPSAPAASDVAEDKPLNETQPMDEDDDDDDGANVAAIAE